MEKIFERQTRQNLNSKSNFCPKSFRGPALATCLVPVDFPSGKAIFPLLLHVEIQNSISDKLNRSQPSHFGKKRQLVD
jgi:hypothetical protein